MILDLIIIALLIRFRDRYFSAPVIEQEMKDYDGLIMDIKD